MIWQFLWRRILKRGNFFKTIFTGAEVPQIAIWALHTCSCVFFSGVDFNTANLDLHMHQASRIRMSKLEWNTSAVMPGLIFAANTRTESRQVMNYALETNTWSKRTNIKIQTGNSFLLADFSLDVRRDSGSKPPILINLPGSRNILWWKFWLKSCFLRLFLKSDFFVPRNCICFPPSPEFGPNENSSRKRHRVQELTSRGFIEQHKLLPYAFSRMYANHYWVHQSAGNSCSTQICTCWGPDGVPSHKPMHHENLTEA